MRYTRIFPVLILIILILFSSCKTGEVETADDLEQTGILGEWKLDSRSVDGIADLSIQCCDYITFKPDSEPQDLFGEFTATGLGYETSGVFELNSSTNTIHFDYDNSQKSYEFQVSPSSITFAYLENDQEIIEDWRKEE